MKTDIIFKQEGELLLSQLPAELNDPIVLSSAKICASSLKDKTYLVTEDKTYEIKWLLSSNEAFLVNGGVAS